jgi:hypothetical protein
MISVDVIKARGSLILSDAISATGGVNMAPNGLGPRLWGVSASIALFLSIPTVFSTTTADNGKLLSLNGINYYGGSEAVSTITTSADFNSTQFDDIVPITVIRTDEAVLTKKDLKEIISNYSITDDVFQVGFLESEYQSIGHLRY